MSLKPEKVGALRIDITLYADGRYGFDYKPPGENRIKVRLKSEADARIKAREILGAARGGHIDRMSISEDEFAEFMQWRAQRLRDIEIPKLCISFLEAKARSGVAAPTMASLRNSANRIQKAFPGNIRHVAREDVVKFLDASASSPQHWNNLRSMVISIWRFARKEGYLPAVLTSVETMEQRKVERTIQTYTPDEFSRLLAAVDKEWLPLLALGGFCGLRPEEIQPNPRHGSYKPALQWSHLKWERSVIDMPATITKDRRRRFAPLTEAAMAFLKDWRAATGPVVPAGFVESARLRWLRASGVAWKQDALRHSFASYRLALRKNMHELTLEMGNSTAMVHDHYLDLKHADEAVEWFALRPKKVPKVPNHPLLLAAPKHTRGA